jgi:hypothetical protein
VFDTRYVGAADPCARMEDIISGESDVVGRRYGFQDITALSEYVHLIKNEGYIDPRRRCISQSELEQV